MTCADCEHGRSWHVEWETYRYQFSDGQSWRDKMVPCKFPDCHCDEYVAISRSTDEQEIMPTPEQVALNKRLKNEHKPQIIIDKDFHELFCKVLKEETDRECDCGGTTSEVRKKAS